MNNEHDALLVCIVSVSASRVLCCARAGTEHPDLQPLTEMLKSTQAMLGNTKALGLGAGVSLSSANAGAGEQRDCFTKSPVRYTYSTPTQLYMFELYVFSTFSYYCIHSFTYPFDHAITHQRSFIEYVVLDHQ